MEDKINLNIFCDKMATGSARCAARRAVDSLQTGVTTRAGKIQSNRALEKRRQQMRLTALSGAVDNVERVGGARRGCRLNPTTRYHRHSERRVHSGASSAANRPTNLYRTYGGKESADQSSRVESSRESGVLRSCATSRGAPSQLRRGRGRHGGSEQAERGRAVRSRSRDKSCVARM